MENLPRSSCALESIPETFHLNCSLVPMCISPMVLFFPYLCFIGVKANKRQGYQVDFSVLPRASSNIFTKSTMIKAFTWMPAEKVITCILYFCLIKQIKCMSCLSYLDMYAHLSQYSHYIYYLV